MNINKINLGRVHSAIMAVGYDIKLEVNKLEIVERMTQDLVKFTENIVDELNNGKNFNNVMNDTIIAFYSDYRSEKKEDSFIKRFLEKLELLEDVEEAFNNHTFWIGDKFVEKMDD